MRSVAYSLRGSARQLLRLGAMGTVDFKNLWMYLHELEDKVGQPEVVPHEETDLHRVFCDEHFCVEQGEGEQTE